MSSFLIALAIAFLGSLCLGLSAQAETTSQPLGWLKARYGRLYTTSDQVVRLIGVNVTGLCSDQAFHDSLSGDNGRILINLERSCEQIPGNYVRLPVYPYYWLGKDPRQNGDPTAYRTMVYQAVAMCAKYGRYVQIDNHQIYSMPDGADIDFWKDIAPHFKDDPHVIFGLYNEPHWVTSEVWRNGGEVTRDPRRDDTPPCIGETKLPYRTCGMQLLLDTIRSTGAKNLVVADLLGWNGDKPETSNLLKKNAYGQVIGTSALSDLQGNGVMYDVHFYCVQPSLENPWELATAGMIGKYALTFGEFGPGDIASWRPSEAEARVRRDAWPSWFVRLTGFAERNGISLSAWCYSDSVEPIMFERGPDDSNKLTAWGQTWAIYVTQQLEKYGHRFVH